MTGISFYERTEVAPNTDKPWRYDLLEVRQPLDHFPADETPSVGDCILVLGRAFRVIDRMWDMAAYGSRNWPINDNQPTHGHHCTLIMVRMDGGVFVGEAELAHDASAD